MASGGSLKVKLPSFTSTSWLIAQPPESSANLSSKTISVPSQADAGSKKPAQHSSAAATPSPDLAISGSLARRPHAQPHGKILIASASSRQPCSAAVADPQFPRLCLLEARQPPSTGRMPIERVPEMSEQKT